MLNFPLLCFWQFLLIYLFTFALYIEVLPCWVHVCLGLLYVYLGLIFWPLCSTDNFILLLNSTSLCACSYQFYLSVKLLIVFSFPQFFILTDKVTRTFGFSWAFARVVIAVQSPSRIWLVTTMWTVACQASLFSTVSWNLPKFMSTELVMLSNHLVLSHPCPFAFSFSQCQSLFQWVSSSHQVAKVLELQLPQQPFQWIFRVGFL